MSAKLDALVSALILTNERINIAFLALTNTFEFLKSVDEEQKEIRNLLESSTNCVKELIKMIDERYKD